MTRRNGDLDAANRHMQQRRQRIDAMRQRTKRQRDRRRQLDLLVAGVCRGWIR